MNLNQTMAANSLKIWTVLFAVGGIFFSLLSALFLIGDIRSISGGQYLITSLLLYVTAFFVHTKKMDMNLVFTKKMLVFTVGFLLTVAGAGTNTDIWSLGFLLYVAGLYHATKGKK
ncbi:putative membrane protein [Methanohalophilus levihalophilus]|uniref:hypothetical protein n=1 Tax=Methanohalophilus levihalophilus TaxID=1431282 RepID=UPI001AE92E30|nr:hypothetical protein [Methanohalophilus levihalophilus]MBP2029093.1 putative membrane protein [Methanohalophilus levihalophilus]